MISDKEQIKSWLANMEGFHAEQAVNAIISWSQDIQGEWNGDESGLQEERAGLANEIEGKANELLELIKEM